MEIVELIEDKNTLRIIVDSNEESLFYLLKSFLSDKKDVEIVGVYKEHHLIDKTEFLFKVSKGNPKEILKKYLAEVKKELQKLKK